MGPWPSPSLPPDSPRPPHPPRRLGEAGARAWGLAPGAPAHECLIELLTGRTHQIRAQLSAAGCPLLGDSLYQPLACPELRQVRWERACAPLRRLLVHWPGDAQHAHGNALQ